MLCIVIFLNLCFNVFNFDSFIGPNFVYWWMVKSTLDDDDEDEGSSDSDEAIEMVEAYRFGDDFGHSFDTMSIKPKESLHNNFAARNSLMQMPFVIRLFSLSS